MTHWRCGSRVALFVAVRDRSRGVALLEVLLAASLLTAVFVGVAQGFAASARASVAARRVTLATVAAVEKMEQLRALPFDDPSLAASPPGSLRTDFDGYWDSPLDDYVRRWSIELLPAHPTAALVVRVAVV